MSEPKSNTQDIREDIVKEAEPHPWHWANEMCPCGAPALKTDRPKSIRSKVPVFR